MYSYEERLRAVQLYIKLGKRVGLTIRQLGYPTKNALKEWHRAYEQRPGLPKGYMREPRYTQAQKKQAVDHFVGNGRCLAGTIKALRYPSRVSVQPPRLDGRSDQSLGELISSVVSPVS